MVFCTKCGFEINEESSKFCSKCGATIIQNSEPKKSKPNLPSNKPRTNPSKKSNKKVIAISVVLSVIAVFVIVPFIMTSLDGFGDGYYLNQRQQKIASCNGDIWTDPNTGGICCFDERKYTTQYIGSDGTGKFLCT